MQSRQAGLSLSIEAMNGGFATRDLNISDALMHAGSFDMNVPQGARFGGSGNLTPLIATNNPIVNRVAKRFVFSVF
jgi:hypothetical protein